MGRVGQVKFLPYTVTKGSGKRFDHAKGWGGGKKF